MSELLNNYPFPYMKQDNYLDNEMAIMIQQEILNIPQEQWDRYDNPFEQKYTLRDKYNFPPLLKQLFEKLESDEFINNISEKCGYKLYKDPTRNFWGVHKYNNGDKLDIHVDAGLHPTTLQKKQVTFGLYLSSNWLEEYGCDLEIWSGDNSCSNQSKINKKVDSIAPIFNRMVMFVCNDYSWHGNPCAVKSPENAKRIFVTISYLSENYEDKNKRVKAFFVKRPEDPDDCEKDKMRLLRCDPDNYYKIYKIN